MAVEQLPGQLDHGVDSKRRGLTFFRSGVLGRGQISSPVVVNAGIPGLNGQDGNSASHEAISPTPPSQEKYPGYRDGPAEAIFRASVVMPRLAAIAERQLPNGSHEDKQVLTTELSYGVQAVEAHPTNFQAQQNMLRDLGVSDERVLDHVAGLMPVLQREQERVFSEAEGRPHNVNERIAKRARRKTENRLGKDIVDLLPESAGLPLEMIKDLAYFNEAVKLFKRETMKKYPDLKMRKLRKDDREQRLDAINAHVNGLLTAFIDSHPVLPDIEVAPAYAEQYIGLKDELNKKKQMIEEDASGWTVAQQHHEIRKAVKNFTSLDEHTLAIKEDSGLTPDMAKEASHALIKESVMTVAWSGGVELAQIGQGGFGNVFDIGPHLLQTNNPWVVGGAAVGSRVFSGGLLVLKGIIGKHLTRLTGVSTDPGMKIAHEVSENPLAGFAGWNGAIEIGFGAYSGLGAVNGGWNGAASTELGTNLGPMGIPRQIIEDIIMLYKVRSIKRRQRALRDEHRTSAPENSTIAIVESLTNVPASGERQMEPGKVVDVRTLSNAS